MAGSPPLTPAQFDRYRRHLSLPELGVEGQQALLAGRVLLGGAGGLGCPLAQYLAAAGVGTLVLAHGGNIKPSDLNRQLLMTHAGLGTPRIASIDTGPAGTSISKLPSVCE